MAKEQDTKLLTPDEKIEYLYGQVRALQAIVQTLIHFVFKTTASRQAVIDAINRFIAKHRIDETNRRVEGFIEMSSKISRSIAKQEQTNQPESELTGEG